MALDGRLRARSGHYLLIVAHQRAPAAVLSPFMYTQLIWMKVLGYLVFGDVPDRYTVAGAAIVVAVRPLSALSLRAAGDGLSPLTPPRNAAPRRRADRRRRPPRRGA